MKHKNCLLGACLAAFFTVFSSSAQTFHSMVPLAGFGPSGNGEMLSDGSIPFLTAGTIQRGMARNPVTGNLIFVDRGVSGQGAEVTGSIYVLNGADGSVVTTLNTNGIQGGGFAHYAAGVGEDGAVYVANVVLATNATITTTEEFKIYRWSNDSTTDAPTVAFSGIMGTNNFRWGNTIDVRGSGANTEILVSAGGTESAVLTTADGLTFTPIILATDFSASLQGSLAFGVGDTYWAKFANQPLRLLSFDRNTGIATTIREFGSANMPEITPHEMVGTDIENHLLASVNYRGAEADQVFLYDIRNTNDAPQLLDSWTLTSINSGQAGSPRGYVMVGGGKLYVHNINNGIFGFDLVDGPYPAPEIVAQPPSQQSLQGNDVVFRVVAQRGLSYQWKKGVNNLEGETNSTLIITNIQFSDSADYSVVVSNPTSSITSSNATLTVLSLEDFYRLTPLWSTAPNTQPYFMLAGGTGNAPNQRSLAYNSFSNHLYVVARTGGTTEYNVHVIDADTGAPLYTLNTNGANFTGFAGQIGLVSIDVADDGSIYACNVDSSGAWKLYRWANGDSNTAPVLVFDGDPFGSPTTTRWGDVMDVRGGGLNTQILIDAQQLASPFFAILQPSDAELTNFNAVVFSHTATSGTVGRSGQFGVGDTIWQKRQNSVRLIHSEFDLDAPFSAAPLIGEHTNLVSTTTQLALDESRNLLGTINNSGVAGASPYQVELYDISNVDAPVLLSQHDFPENKRANADIGKVVFGGDKMFALNAQNGVVAFRIEIGALPPTLNITLSGSNVVLTWEGSDFILESKTDLNSETWTNVPYQAGTPNTVTEAASGTAKFYRLRK